MSINETIKQFLSEEVVESKVLVLGDVMLDRYFYGTVNRISPEAPVPIDLIYKKEDTLGGAANVAHNLAKLGCQVELVGVVGEDHHGHLLKKEMTRLNIGDKGVISCRKNTTTKVRVIGGHQQMLRMDFEETSALDDSTEKEVLSYVKMICEDGINAIILSDYGKGVCSKRMCQNIIELAHRNHVLVYVDPKGNDWDKYRGADYITPNVNETRDVIGYEILNQDDSLRTAANKIKDKYDIRNVIITRSEKGMSLFLEEDEYHIPTVAKEVFDVSGAGDTVISVLSAGISGNLSVYESSIMANLAAGIGVGKVGAYAVSREEIIACL